MKNSFRIIVAVYFLFILSSCGKDKNPPEIIIYSPNQNQQLNSGVTLQLKGKISDLSQITEVKGLVINLTTNDELINFTKNPNTANFDFVESVSITVSSFYNYEFRLNAKDEKGNESSIIVPFSVKP